MTDWLSADELAEAHGLKSASVVAQSARHYEQHGFARHPILRDYDPDKRECDQYTYRWDHDAQWSAEKIDKVARHTGLSRHELCERIGVSSASLANCLREGGWLGLSYQQKMSEIASELSDDYCLDLSAEVVWYAICDRTFKRHVVQSVYYDLETAKSKYERRSGKVCPKSLVRGEGDAPEVGKGLKVSRRGVDYVLIRSSWAKAETAGGRR